MRPDPHRTVSTATPRTAGVLALAVALGVLIVFVVRDGFAAGDLLGALVIGLATFAVLMLLRSRGRR